MQQPVRISSSAFAAMLRTAELLERLARSAPYRQAIETRLPKAARFDPVLPSLLMGYDFHLGKDEIPYLIEVNTNAGGLFWQGRWLAQPPLWNDALQDRLASMFPASWKRMAIVDMAIKKQPMYPEMQAYAELLRRRRGMQIVLAEPASAAFDRQGRFCIAGLAADGIYNRCTDFYLQTPAMRPLREAYLRRRVQLSPHPHAFGLLADKRRMIDWCLGDLLRRALGDADAAFLQRHLLPTYRLSDFDRERLWQERKKWVFKPPASHAGKGVLLGRSISRKRFLALPKETIVQRWAPPGEVEIEGERWRFDVRLYFTAGKLVAVGARIWRGQVASFRQGGGFAPLWID